MEFINTNMEILVIIGLITGTLALGLGLIPYLQRKKYITIEGVKISKEILSIFKLLLIEMNFKNKNTKEQAILIFDITDSILNYIKEDMSVDDVEKQKQIAYKMIVDVLEDLDIEITENRKQLIKLSIDEALENIKI